MSLIITLLFHMVVLFFVKKEPDNFNYLPEGTRPIKIERIELISKEEVEQMKRVGIKGGAKNKFFQPDELKIPKAAPPAGHLSLGNLGPVLPLLPKGPDKAGKQKQPAESTKNKRDSDLTSSIARPPEEGKGNIFFNPKKEKRIRRDRDQDNLKQEAYSNNTASSANSPIAQKMTNFDIRYERPEGVSEDELNSDEKAYYSFFKRSYANYLTKLYATYEKVAIERPGIEKDFNNKHTLLGRIDYDEKGNIIMVKILKSSDSDDIHYFFEETLKQLNLPNPPRSFIKSKKQFTTYYQIQIN